MCIPYHIFDGAVLQDLLGQKWISSLYAHGKCLNRPLKGTKVLLAFIKELGLDRVNSGIKIINAALFGMAMKLINTGGKGPREYHTVYNVETAC